MTRHEFRAFRSACRKAKRSSEILHNGRRWTIGRDGCQRLDSSGCFDRVGRLHLALDHAADCRRRQKLKGATRGILSLVREWRALQVTA